MKSKLTLTFLVAASIFMPVITYSFCNFPASPCFQQWGYTNAFGIQETYASFVGRMAAARVGAAWSLKRFGIQPCVGCGFSTTWRS